MMITDIAMSLPANPTDLLSLLFALGVLYRKAKWSARIIKLCL